MIRTYFYTKQVKETGYLKINCYKNLEKKPVNTGFIIASLQIHHVIDVFAKVILLSPYMHQYTCTFIHCIYIVH